MNPNMAIGLARVYIFVCTSLCLFSSSLSYLEYGVENGKVCSILHRPDLKLGDKENSAIILKEHRYFDKWSGRHQFHCNFTVIAPGGHGIIAVIQNLDLRQNETTKECIDYVQFLKRRTGVTGLLVLFGADVPKSRKFCGSINSIRDPDVLDSEPEAVIAENAIVEDKGRLDVSIVVADQHLLSSQNLDLTIVFTAFKLCGTRPPDGMKECRRGSGMCIWEGFFHDSYINCPSQDCPDEGGCPRMSGGRKQSSGLGTKVTIGAVVLILGLLVLFMLCLFICRKCQVLCWSNMSASRPQRSAQQPSRVEMTIPPSNIGVSGGQTLPTAPPLLPISTASPVHEDKDLPPPYESLFPPPPIR